MLPQHPQKLHRRQNSTPSVFAGVKKPSVTGASARSSKVSCHRRGLSLDTRQLRMAPSTETTARLSHMHHLLRETQQHSTSARPGPEQLSPPQQPYLCLSSPLSSDDVEYLTPSGTPLSKNFDVTAFDLAQPPFGWSRHDDAHFSSDIKDGSDFDLFFSSSPAQSTPSFHSFQDSPISLGYISEEEPAHNKKTLRRISNGIRDRVDKFEGFGSDPLDRPSTPPTIDSMSYPPTPMDTPQEYSERAFPGDLSRPFYDMGMETLKPSHIRQNSLAESSNTFEFMRSQVEAQSQQSVESQGFFPYQPLFSDFTIPAAPYPDLYQGALPMEPFHYTQAEVTTAPAGPAHRRSESLQSTVSASGSIASMAAGLNLAEARTETGVSCDEINKHIQGPNSEGKWKCSFPGCPKDNFGRKENIRSHVQTHLDDRQFQCPECKKCFVRQHDLKRHVQTHVGAKPYVCPCEADFARKDALDRHRKRGMCVGAYSGVVRQPAKRGRPRKNRPGMEERTDKAHRTRQKNGSASGSGPGYSSGSGSISSLSSPQLSNGSMYSVTPSPTFSSAPMPTSASMPVQAFAPSLAPVVNTNQMFQSQMHYMGSASTAPMPVMDNFDEFLA